ncbi:MAG TPA: sigma-54-dependent Fis family transcriptional regulator [Planctomycetota bacterium]|nr:sigma-54-dependent Fis family transcriptional regulator [Planctomycetota bacterium]
MRSDPLATALGRIARTIAESLDLKEVFARVAEEASTVLPYDELSILKVGEGGTLTLYAFVGNTAGPPRTLRLEEFSPALRPRPDESHRYRDLEEVYDESFPVDREMRALGLRSLLCHPLRRGDHLAGYVGVASKEPRVYGKAHEAALRSIADLLVVALEQARLWNLDAGRRRRLDAIDGLLLTMAPVLDLRAAFQQISAVVQRVLPHDRLMLTSLDPQRRVITMDALSGEPVPGLPTVNSAEECHQPAEDVEYEIVPDIEAEMAGDEDSPCARIARLLGVRSGLRIPMVLEDGRVGSLFFLAGTPNRYSEEDVPVARRVADHVGLALSHHRLAAEERRAAEERQRASLLEERVEALREELASSRGFRRVVGESKSWSEVLSHATRVSATETTVLLTGESGTGKEVVARFLHRGSPRAKGPFAAINCAALPEALLESELFGHEKGAFTGAASSRAGCIERADGGVLFLDEVGEMSPAVQAKFLRVLQEREYQRLGGDRTLRANVRVVAATNRDLEAAIRQGRFREDLYYRLKIFEIRLPPLRERPDDILPLAEAFLDEVGAVVGRPAAGISRDAREVLLGYRWPGNVRELRNVLERATILCDGGLIAADHLPRELSRAEGVVRDGPVGAVAALAGGFNLEAAEKDLIVRALEASGNNRSQAARLLGLARPQLYTRLRRHGLEPDGARASSRA